MLNPANSATLLLQSTIYVQSKIELIAESGTHSCILLLIRKNNQGNAMIITAIVISKSAKH